MGTEKKRDPIAARGSKQPGFPACRQSVVVPGLQLYSLQPFVL